MINYDMDNEETFYWVHQVCMVSDTIPFYNKTINIPKIKDLMMMNKETYGNLLKPYVTDLISLFYVEDLCVHGNDDLLYCAICGSEREEINEYNEIIYKISLSYFFNIEPNNIYVNKDYKNKTVDFNLDVSNDLLCINSDIFRELSKIIRMIFNMSIIDISKIRKEQQTEEKNFGKVRKRFARLLKADRKAEKDIDRSNEFCNIFNRILPVNNFDYSKIYNKNVYQFYNDYKVCTTKEYLDFNSNIASSGMAQLPKDFNSGEIYKPLNMLIKYDK